MVIVIKEPTDLKCDCGAQVTTIAIDKFGDEVEPRVMCDSCVSEWEAKRAEKEYGHLDSDY